MDDTNWISDSQDYLESILQIADEFYDLTRATINKYKSCLLTNITRKSHLILIKFSSNTIPISPFFSFVRFLGVLINIHLKRSLIKKDFKQHIQQFIRLIRYKPITDHQFTYINNMVLLSQLQYRMQITPLFSNECHTYDVITRKNFKSINKFPYTASNILFNSFNFYDLKDL